MAITPLGQKTNDAPAGLNIGASTSDAKSESISDLEAALATCADRSYCRVVDNPLCACRGDLL